MILLIGIVSLLVTTHSGWVHAGVKGGRRPIVTQIIREPQIAVDDGVPYGNYGTYAAGTPLVTITGAGGGYGIDPAVQVQEAIGLGGPGLGFGGNRDLYRIGQSVVPFGLSGSDYYSYPAIRLTGGGLGGGLGGIKGGGLGGIGSGLGGIGSGLGGADGGGLGAIGSGLGGIGSGFGGIGSGLGGVKGGGLGGPGYTIGQSRIPFGLSGLDFFSFPNSLLTQGLGGGLGGVKGGGLGNGLGGGLGSGLGGVKGGGLGSGLGGIGSGLGGIGSGLGGIGSGLGGVKGGALGSGLGGIGSGLGGPGYAIGQSRIPFGLSGLDFFSFPNSLLSQPRFFGSTKTGPRGVGGIASALSGKTNLLGGSGIQELINPGIGGGIGSGGVLLGGGGSGLNGIKGGNRIVYRNGQSVVPFGLSGLDFGSYPSYLGNGRRLSKIGTGNIVSPFAQSVQDVIDPSIGGGIGSGGLLGGGPGDIQLTLGDSGLSGIPGGGGGGIVYRNGQSVVPFGLSGLDFSSYPSYLGNGRRLSKIGTGNVVSPFAQSVQGVIDPSIGGLGSGSLLGGGPGAVQLTLGDSGLGGIPGGGGGIVYRNGQSVVPFGLSGLDFSSYPSFLGNGRRVSKIGTGNVVSPFAQNVQNVIDPSIGGLGSGGLLGGGPGAVQLTLGDSGLGGIPGGGGGGIVYRNGQSVVPFGLSGLDFSSYPSFLGNGRRVSKIGTGNVVSPFAQNVQNVIDPSIGGLGSGGLLGGGPGAVQFTLGDSGLGGIPGGGGGGGIVYRNGQSVVPFGLSGSDFSSYPSFLGNGRRVSKIGTGNVVSPFAQNVQNVIDPSIGGLGSGGLLGGGPGAVQLTLGDSGLGGIPGGGFGGIVYRNGQSAVPFGLSGLDFSSYPSFLGNGRRVSKIGTGNVVSPFAQNVQNVIDPSIGGLGSGGLLGGGPGAVQLTLGDSGLGGLPGGGGGIVYRNGQSVVPFGLSGLDFSSYPSYLGNGRGVSKIGTGGVLSPFASSPLIQENIDPGLGGSGGVISQALTDVGIGGGSGFGATYGMQRSQIPYGALGLDYSSYPTQLLSQSRPGILGGLGGGSGIIQERIEGGGLGGPVQEKIILGSDIGGPGNIQLGGGGLGGIPVQERIAAISPGFGTGAGNIQFTFGGGNGGSILGGGGGRGIGPQAVTVVRKTVVGSGLGGISGGIAPASQVLSGIGGIVPSNIQFTLGGAGLTGPGFVPQATPVVRKTNFGGIGAGSGVFPFGQRKISAGLGPAVQSRVTYVDSGLGAGSGGVLGGGGQVISRPAVLRRPAVVRTSPGLGVQGPVRGIGAGSIQFTLGGAQLIGGSGQGISSGIRPTTVTRVAPQRLQIVRPTGGIGLGGGRRVVGVSRTSPVRVVQQPVRAVGGGLGPNIQFTLGGNQIIGGPGGVAAGGAPAVSVVQPQRLTRVRTPVRVAPAPVRVVQERVFGGLGSGGLGGISRVSPAQVAQERVVGFGDSGLGGISGIAPAPLVQEQVGLGNGGFGRFSGQGQVVQERIIRVDNGGFGGISGPGQVAQEQFIGGPIGGSGLGGITQISQPRYNQRLTLLAQNGLSGPSYPPSTFGLRTSGLSKTNLGSFSGIDGPRVIQEPVEQILVK